MTETQTAYGRLCVGDQATLFARAASLVAERHATAALVAERCATAAAATDTAIVAAATHPFTCALSGGSTPQAWFSWCVATRALPASVTATTHFTVSDERHVPLTDPQSNFGHAARLLLDPLAVPPAHRHPWPVALPPALAAESYRTAMRPLAAPGHAYDVCFLGLGEDAHTASLFPGSPLLSPDLSGGAEAKDPPGTLTTEVVSADFSGHAEVKSAGEFFTALEVPGKGWRLTITPAGLRACGQIVVMALGSTKTVALHRILRGPHDPLTTPAQILKTCADRVVWLVDEAAAGKL